MYCGKEVDSKIKFTLSNYINWKIYIVLILAVFFVSGYVRYNQYNRWKQNKSLYFVDNYPAMTTLDAYYWLRYAKEDKNGTYYKNDNDTLRAYPDTTGKPHYVPMLSFLISKISNLSNSSIYNSGLFLVPILASLFVIPLSLYFYYAEMPMAGILGSFVGTFSWMYFIRTSMGRVDTDLLQLFFLFLASLFLMLFSKEKDKKLKIVYSALIGLTLAFFGWWYSHNGIILIYMILLVVMAFINKVDKKTTILSFVAFIIFANPLYVYGAFGSIVGFFHNYFSITNSSGEGFPNILKTITEAEHVSFSKVLQYILSNKVIDVFGLLSFAVSIVFLKKYIIPILPILFLGLLSFHSSNRMVMFLSPFVGLGLGFLIDFAASYISRTKDIKKCWISFIATASAFLLIFALMGFSAVNFNPKPSIAPDIVKSFINIKKKIKYADIVSWWDYGYAIEDIDGFATYHDGGAHGGARTYFIAKGFSCDNQTKFYNTISYIDSNGIKSINDRIKSGEKVVSVVDSVLKYDKKIKNKNNYILFTRDMIGKFSAISYLGNWSFKLKKSAPIGFQILGCNRYDNGILYCSGNRFDFNKGLINNKIPIKRAFSINNGYVIDKKEYYDKGINVETILRNRKLLFIMICNDKAFNTNFNQMYILGNYNKELYKEVYNNFPSARMFQLK